MDELGEGTVELMRMVKRAVDPHNLLNPGKASSQYNVSKICIYLTIFVQSCIRTRLRLRNN